MKSYNLPEYVKYHPYHISTFAEFANVTPELMKAVVNGTEELTETELFRITKYSGIPYSVLICPKLILLDRNNRRHQRMLEELAQKLYIIREYEKQGLFYAKLFMKYGRMKFVNLELDFKNGCPVSYTRYLGVKEQMEQTISWCTSSTQEPRGLRK